MSVKWHDGFKHISLIISLLMNIVNFIANWLLYAGINVIQPGLVIGPYSPVFSDVVLGLCILSSVVNILEVYFLYVELFRKQTWKCWLNGNNTSVLAIWLDDIPKAIIMILIAVCHDMAISYEEIVRASLLMVTLVIRLTAFLVRDCIRRQRKGQSLPTWDEVRVRRGVCCSQSGFHYGAILLGLLIKLVAFFIIYSFTFLGVYPGGRIGVKQPSGIINPTPDFSRYLANVSVFARVESNSTEPDGWLEVASVMDVVRHGSCFSKLKLTPGAVAAKSVCGQESAMVNRSVAGSPESNPEQAPLFELRFVEPSKSFLLGNIEYRWLSGGKTFNDSQFVLKYFCLPSTDHLPPRYGFMNVIGLVKHAETQKTTSRVYGRKAEEETIVAMPYCRRTGIGKCKMTGLDGPKLVRHFSFADR